MLSLLHKYVGVAFGIVDRRMGKDGNRGSSRGMNRDDTTKQVREGR